MMKKRPSLHSAAFCFFLCLLFCAVFPLEGAAKEAQDAQPSALDSTAGPAEGEMAVPEGRVVYQEGFFYEPIQETVKQRILGISYAEDCTVPMEELRYVRILYVDFYGQTQQGEQSLPLEVEGGVAGLIVGGGEAGGKQHHQPHHR